MTNFSDKRVRSVLTAVLLCGLRLFAATDGALILENANSNENIYSSATGEFISYLRGDVVFRYEDVRITADEATWQKNDGVIDFSGNITAEQNGQALTCERLHFVRDKNLLTATKNVLYRDSAGITFIRGDTAEYMTDKKEALLYGKPLLTRIDSAGVDTVFLRGRTVKYNDSLKIATVTDSVSVIRGELNATCEKGVYFVNGNMAVLRINPVIYYENHKIIGDSVDLFLGKESLESAIVTGNTHGHYTEASDSSADTTVMHIWSDSLHLSMFESGKINFIKAFGDARGSYSEYADSSGRATRTNIASDSLHMFMFESGKVRAMRAFGSAHGRNAEWGASSKDTSITHIWSDSLRVLMNDVGKIKTMRAGGRAISRNFLQSDSARASEVSGHTMTIRFGDNGKIEKAVVTGDAKSTYFLEDSDGGGCNNTSGSQIIVTFSAGKAQRLRVRGNVKGVYSP